MAVETEEPQLGAAGAVKSSREHEAQLVHILVVPFHLEGHLNGMLRLAQALAAQEHVLITFAYPARFHHLAGKRNKLSSLNSATHRTSALLVQVVEDGLPFDEEAQLTSDLIFSSIPTFQNAAKLLLHSLLHQSKASTSPPPSCIISDTFVPWTQDLADATGLHRVDFWTSTAAIYSMGYCLSSLISKGILPLPQSAWADAKTKWVADAPLIDCIPGLPPFPVTDLPHEFVVPEEVSDPRLQFMVAAFGRTREAYTILLHSVYELESEVFDALQADGLPVLAVGPLLHSTSEPADANNKHECLEWLDKQPPSSVMYVALGSLAKLNPVEMHALAHGLEASGHPFLWVIRKDAIAGTGSLSDALPEGFLKRTTEKRSGLIISWAPQTEVLRHGSIGAFFSHCGWNSTLESLWEGVPIVACPRGAEQRSNARWIEEKWKIGTCVERQVDGSFTKEAVQRALEEVVGGAKGSRYREGALEAKALARVAVQEEGTSHANLVRFLQGLRLSPPPHTIHPSLVKS